MAEESLDGRPLYQTLNVEEEEFRLIEIAGERTMHEKSMFTNHILHSSLKEPEIEPSHIFF